MTTARAIRLPRLPRSLTVNALALMTASIGANGLGLAFWAVAAHLRPSAIVGQASAAITALTLLSMIAKLNLTNVIVRLLPTASVQVMPLIVVWRLGPAAAAYLTLPWILLLAAVLVLLPRLGLTAVGWAYLATQAVLAAAVAPFTVRHIRRAEFARA
jgi:hypothetical protein